MRSASLQGVDIAETIINDLRDEIGAATHAFAHTLDDLDLVERAGDFNQALLDAQADMARLRREAVRRLRQTMTLREIGEAVGMAHQRIAQIERGMDRKEKG